MNKLIILLTGFSFLAADSTTMFTTFNDLDPKSLACPECTKKFESCTQPIYDTYAEAVEIAADKLKAHTITEQDYRDACNEARKVMNNADALCMSEYQKCCLIETKEIIDKEKQAQKIKN